MYQRALIQSENTHNFVDRIFAVIGFDLANETVLKVTVSALKPAKKIADSFQSVLDQAEVELNARSIVISDKTKIQHVHNLRNDAQHKAKYPNEYDASDCRTYTRDFLTQIFSDVWGKSFESMSMIDSIQNQTIKSLLLEAEQDLIKDDFKNTIVKSKAAFQMMITGIADLLTEQITPKITGIFVEQIFKKPESNRELFDAFISTRDLIAFQIIGISSLEFLKYKRITRFINMTITGFGRYTSVRLSSSKGLNKEAAEFVISFVTNATILIERFDEDIRKNGFYN
jgi:hypothetical protein